MAPPSTFATAIGHVPYVGPLYNIANSVAHALNGTLGQNGQSPSLLGRFAQYLGIGNQPVAGWRQNASTQTPAPTPAAVPQSQHVPGVQTLGQFLANNPGVSQYFSNPNFYNANRVPFSQTFQQGAFPGSGIGPFQGPSVPWALTRGAQGLGTPNTVVTQAPGWASAFSNYIASRNQP